MFCGRPREGKDAKEGEQRVGTLSEMILWPHAEARTTRKERNMSLKITNGAVVDGTGRPRYKSDVLVEGDTIARVEADLAAEPADTELDATGCVVTPGFIDVHSHTDFGILGNPPMAAKLMQGITTDVVGNCGLGFYPVNDRVFAYYEGIVKNLIGVEVQQFERLRDFMAAVETGRGTGINLGFLMPHGNVRAFVLGMREGEPTAEELTRAREILEQGMKDGALGMSTGLIYPPGSLASTSELVSLAEVVARYDGIYASHVRNEGAGVIEAIEEAISIGRQAGCRVEISHVKVGTPLGAKRKTKKLLATLEAARAAGVAVTADQYPYDSANTELAAMALPAWVFDGPADEFQDRLRDPANRERIVEEFYTLMMEQVHLPRVVRIVPKKTMLKLMLRLIRDRVIVTAVKHNHAAEGLTLGEAVAKYYPGQDVINGVLDFLADEEGAINISMHLMKQASIDLLQAWPHTMIGSDSIVPVEGNCHPRSFGTFPRVLSECVARGVVSLEEAVRKMTSLPAETFQLAGRGYLKPGACADLVVFDPETVRDTAHFGAARSYPEGIKYVVVNGQLAARDGAPEDVLAGRVLRHSPTPAP